MGGGAEETAIRQTSAVIGPLTSRWSVVIFGVVRCRRTTSPTRSAVRSFANSGRLREGGCGGAGLAQPAAQAIGSAEADAIAIFGHADGRR